MFFRQYPFTPLWIFMLVLAIYLFNLSPAPE